MEIAVVPFGVITVFGVIFFTIFFLQMPDTFTFVEETVGENDYSTIEFSPISIVFVVLASIIMSIIYLVVYNLMIGSMIHAISVDIRGSMKHPELYFQQYLESN